MQIYSTSIEQMKGLGYLEETILLLIMLMDDDAYGYSVSMMYEKHMGKAISISAIHAVMSRLEKKGLISSYMGGATPERGGRQKRIFEVTAAGRQTISDIKDNREKLWDLIPDLS